VELDQTPESGARLSVLERVRRHLPEIGAVYFAEDTPLVYFSVQDHHSPQTLADLHRHVWKDSRVPLLFAIDRSQIRVYDAWATPRSDSPIDEDPTRIIKCLQSTARALQGFDALKRIQLETGAFMKSHPQRFRTSGRCDLTLLENLEHVYSALVSASVPQEIAHRLLLRSILLLHLEHREVLGEDFLHRFCPDASSITEVYASRDSTYELFQQLSKSKLSSLRASCVVRCISSQDILRFGHCMTSVSCLCRSSARFTRGFCIRQTTTRPENPALTTLHIHWWS